MKVLFDVDGTLVRSSALDAEVFAKSFASLAGSPLPSTDWSTFAEATDESIAAEALARAGSKATASELKARFVEALAERLHRSAVQPVPGAATVLRELERAGHSTALATGAWAASARLKLASAGIDAAGVLLFGSDGLPTRIGILSAALAGWRGRAVYVADAEWDVRAAKAVGLPLVLIRREGEPPLDCPVPTLTGFDDIRAVLLAIDLARVPKR